MNSRVITGALHRLLETHATVRALCILGPSVRSPRSNRAKRTLALWAWCAVQQQDNCHESGEQSGKREPSQPKAIGRKDCGQNAKDDARKHEQHRPISTSLQITSYRHRPTSYRRHSRSGHKNRGRCQTSRCLALGCRLHLSASYVTWRFPCRRPLRKVYPDIGY